MFPFRNRSFNSSDQEQIERYEMILQPDRNQAAIAEHGQAFWVPNVVMVSVRDSDSIRYERLREVDAANFFGCHAAIIA
jgi:hypothetical protein